MPLPVSVAVPAVTDQVHSPLRPVRTALTVMDVGVALPEVGTWKMRPGAVRARALAPGMLKLAGRLTLARREAAACSSPVPPPRAGQMAG